MTEKSYLPQVLIFVSYPEQWRLHARNVTRVVLSFVRCDVILFSWSYHLANGQGSCGLYSHMVNTVLGIVREMASVKGLPAQAVKNRLMVTFIEQKHWISLGIRALTEPPKLNGSCDMPSYKLRSSSRDDQVMNWRFYILSAWTPAMHPTVRNSVKDARNKVEARKSWLSICCNLDIV